MQTITTFVTTCGHPITVTNLLGEDPPTDRDEHMRLTIEAKKAHPFCRECANTSDNTDIIDAILHDYDATGELLARLFEAQAETQHKDGGYYTFRRIAAVLRSDGVRAALVAVSECLKGHDFDHVLEPTFSAAAMFAARSADVQLRAAFPLYAQVVLE